MKRHEPTFDPAYLTAKEKMGKTSKSLPKRRYGRTKEKLSIIGFGGMMVMDASPKEAANFVAEAVDRGVNYFDVAPYYGNAQQRLGPALKPYRQNCFMACKTLERDAVGASKELHQSLKLLKTDHFDLYQLHALSDVEEVEQAFGLGGAMETILKAKQDGKIRYIGFSAHSEEAAHAAMDRFDFDSILPVSPGFSPLDQGELRPVRLQAGEESGDGHPGSEGDGPRAVAEG
jgi:aryl-alcohol dehydrogenase-like predicted oxidoreductase